MKYYFLALIILAAMISHSCSALLSAAVLLDLKRIEIEGHGIVRRGATDFAEGSEHLLGLGIAEAEKIYIARRAKWLVEPGRHQHRAF